MQPVPGPLQARNYSLLFFAHWGYIGVSSTFTSLFFAERGMSVAHIAILMSLVQLSRIAGPNLWGWVADHADRRVGVLRVAALAALVCYLGLALGSGFTHFFIAMVGVNLCTSAQRPLTNAMLLSELRGDLSRYGRMRLWGSIGFVVVASLAGRLLDRFGIGLMPWIGVAMLALLAATSIATREPPAQPAHGPAPSVAALLKRREIIAFFTANFLMLAGHAALYVYLSLYLAQLGYSKSVIGLLWALGAMAEIVFYFFQAPLLKRWSAAHLMVACQLIAVLRFLMIGWGAESLLLLVLAQLLQAATGAGYQTASMATVHVWFSGPLLARGQALLISVSYGLGGALGALAVGWLWTAVGPQAVYPAAAACVLAGAVAAALSAHWQGRQAGAAC